MLVRTLAPRACSTAQVLPRAQALLRALCSALRSSAAACPRRRHAATPADLAHTRQHAHTSQTPIIMDIRARPRVINSATGTKDLQTANISLRVLSRPDESMLPTIFKQLGEDFDDRVLPSLGNEVTLDSSHMHCVYICTASLEYYKRWLSGRNRSRFDFSA
jgi:hypothetical protein